MYRISRNFEASIYDYLTEQLETDWSNVRVVISSSEITGETVPAVCIGITTTDHKSVEIGSTNTLRECLIILDIYATDDGLRLDLKDYIVSKVKTGIPYYLFEDGEKITAGEAGRITVKLRGDEGLYRNIDKNTLDKTDRYRHRITLLTRINEVES